MQQTKPALNKNAPVVGLVMKDLADRMVVGINTYGAPLQTFNGRSALQDLYEELLDACCYLKQRLEEEKEQEDAIKGLVNAVHDIGTT